MTDKPQAPHSAQRQVAAYERMLERIKDYMDHATTGVKPRLDLALENAKEAASELGELTREEAELIGDYLKRDLHDAAEFITENQKGFVEWLRFDLALVEARLAELFASMADHTALELNRLAQRARAVGEWHTGEITGPGTLECSQCAEKVHFHRTGHIPPCPRCKGTHFKRRTP